MIVGAQKAGTTALAEFLAEHPGVELAKGKEAHLFDAPEFDDSWSNEEINKRYEVLFSPDENQLKGEATPIYLYVPEIASRLSKYNPGLKLIILLRDPVERAYSHYIMEKNRGNESLPFWFALLMETLRLWRDCTSLEEESSRRRHSYRDRGYYARQMRNLLSHIKADQILVIRTEDLRHHHSDVMRRVFDFLEIDPHPVNRREVFSQATSTDEVPISSYFLRKCFASDLRLLATMVDFSVKDWIS